MGCESEVRRQQGRLGHHRAAAGAVARKPLGLPSHLGPGFLQSGGWWPSTCRGSGHSDGRPELIAPDTSGAFLARLIDEWGLGAPHLVGPDIGTAAALYLAARAPERVTSLTVGGGAVRFPIEAGGALRDIIEAPSLDVVRGLDARTNIGYAVEPAAASDSEPDVHEDYVSAYDLGRFAESARFVRHYPEQNPVLRDLLPTITTPTQIVTGATMTSCRGRTTSTSTTSSPTARSILSTRVTSRGSKSGGIRPPASSTGSAAGIGASRRANPSCQISPAVGDALRRHVLVEVAPEHHLCLAFEPWPDFYAL